MLTLGLIIGVFIISIVGIARGGNGKPKDIFGDEAAELYQRFGIDQVSGFYGPGSWAAWLFTVASSAIDRGFGREASLDAKSAHLMGLDLNLVVAYGYPLVAAIDLISHMDINLSEDIISPMMGTLAARVLIVRTGTALGACLTTICVYSWLRERSLARTAVFSIICTTLLFMTAKLFELAYENFSSSAILQTIFWLPGTQKTRSQVLDLRLDKIARSPFKFYGQNALLGFAYNLDKLDRALRRVDAMFFTLYVLPATLLLVLNVYVRFKDRPVYIGLLLTFFGCTLLPTVLWWVVQVFMLWFQMLFMLLSHPPERAVPLSLTKVTDLDQMTALILSGVFVLLFTIRDLFGRERERILSATQAVGETLSSFGEVISEAVRSVKRQTGGTNIAGNF